MSKYPRTIHGKIQGIVATAAMFLGMVACVLWAAFMFWQALTR